jgi:cytochrome P450/NADPH-cytochrome P450 reductase
MPAFGPLPIKSMFPGNPRPRHKDHRTQLTCCFTEMQDIVSQMALKWARFGPDHAIDVPDDFTRLTLDSIAMFVFPIQKRPYF